MKRLLVRTLLALPYFAAAQNIDTLFSETVRSVQFMPNGSQTENMPAIELKKGSLTLNFDEVGGELRNLSYTVEQCDRDWKSTKLDKLEYLEGLGEDRITNFKNSQATNIQFVHFNLTIPNNTVRWNKSGNYVLKIFEDNSEKTPVLTRRFVVYEQVLTIENEFAVPNAIKFNSYHELDFKLDPKTFRVQNPMNDIRVTVLQNARWDLARMNVPPTFVMGDKIVYDYLDSITFQAGKEWRYVDLRSTKFRSERVAAIDKGEETFDVILRTDLDRSREPYLIYQDLNGGFFTATMDYPNQSVDPSVSADYVNTIFTLKQTDEIDDSDVYLFGKLTDYKIDPRFKMTYNPQRSRYEGEVLLKQGYYDYMYVVVPKGKTTHIDFAKLEGNWFATENEYQFIVYFRPFGARYDRVIGYQKYKSTLKR
jgi:Domain of unknown function (DUF5103)